METTELGALLLGLSLLVLFGLAYPPTLLLTAAVGVVFLLLGYLQDRPRSTESEPKPDLVECPGCRGLESRSRTTCRFCGEPLSDTAME